MRIVHGQGMKGAALVLVRLVGFASAARSSFFPAGLGPGHLHHCRATGASECTSFVGFAVHIYIYIYSRKMCDSSVAQ